MLGKEKVDSDSDQSLSKDNVHLLVSLKQRTTTNLRYCFTLKRGFLRAIYT
jgi:hypothetical protein